MINEVLEEDGIVTIVPLSPVESFVWEAGVLVGSMEGKVFRIAELLEWSMVTSPLLMIVVPSKALEAPAPDCRSEGEAGGPNARSRRGVVLARVHLDMCMGCPS